MRIFVLVIFTCIVSVAPASARWLYEKKESAFGSNTLSMMFTANAQYGFGIRCSSDELEAVFATPDRSFDEDTLILANATIPKLLLRIDDHEPRELIAEIYDQDGEAVIVADVGQEVVADIGSARSKISVAIRLLGEIYHEQTFSALGSTAAASKLNVSCDLSESVTG